MASSRRIPLLGVARRRDAAARAPADARALRHLPRRVLLPRQRSPSGVGLRRPSATGRRHRVARRAHDRHLRVRTAGADAAHAGGDPCSPSRCSSGALGGGAAWRSPSRGWPSALSPVLPVRVPLPVDERAGSVVVGARRPPVFDATAGFTAAGGPALAASPKRAWLLFGLVMGLAAAHQGVRIGLGRWPRTRAGCCRRRRTPAGRALAMDGGRHRARDVRAARLVAGGPRLADRGVRAQRAGSTRSPPVARGLPARTGDAHRAARRHRRRGGPASAWPHGSAGPRLRHRVRVRADRVPRCSDRSRTT